MEITKKHDQPLLSRMIVSGSVAFDGATSSNDKLSKDIASSLKIDSSLVVMKSIRTLFGKNIATFEAAVYKDNQAREQIEVKTKKQKEAEAKAAIEAKKVQEEVAKVAQESKQSEVKNV